MSNEKHRSALHLTGYGGRARFRRNGMRVFRCRKKTGLRWRLHPRDKPGLLWAVLKQVDGLDGRIALEGYLGKTTLLARVDASPNETFVLERQGYAVPPADFVVLPLSTELIHQLQVDLSASGAFVQGGWLHHVQIEIEGTLAFGGYDNFHKECVIASSPLTESFLEGLVQNGVLVAYVVDD